METLILYFGKMILCSGVMFGYYFVFLKDKTFHHYNRFYLLSILFLSIFLPLIKIDYFTIEVNPDLFLLLKNLKTVQPQNFAQNDLDIYPIIFSAIGLVSVFFILKFLFGLIKIQRLKNQFPKTEFEGIKFYETPLEEAPFSFFRNLFWKNSISIQSDLGRQILKHEMVHIEQKHTWDKIIMTTINSIFWFNPIFYLIKKEIVLIHEYLADKKAVKQSDTKAFAQMLLASHFSETSLPATSPFLSSNLKKRIIMLKKSHTKFSYLRKISALPLIFFLAFAYLVNAKNREIKETNQVIAKAVSEIKNDTIKQDIGSANVEAVQTEASDPNSVENRLKIADDRALYIVRGDEVSRKEFLEFLEKNKGNKKMMTSCSTGESEMLKKNFGVVGPYGKFEKYGVFQVDFIGDINPEKYWKIQDKYYPQWRRYTKSLEKPEVRAKLNRLMKEEDQKMIENKVVGKKEKIYYATATYKEDTVKQYTQTFIVPGLLNSSNDDINKPFKKAVENATESNQFFINQRQVSKTKYQKFFNSNYGNKSFSFGSGVSAMDTNNPIKFFYVNHVEDLIQKNAELKAKVLEQTNFVKEAEKVKTESRDFSKTIVIETPNNITPPISKKSLGLKSKPQQESIFEDKDVKYYVDGKLVEGSTWKKILPQNIISMNIEKNPGQKDGGNVYIITKGERSGPNPILYNKIFINGKLSTQSELDKIKDDSIKTQNISKNNENGKTYNEIRVVTK